jgi:hypothetical protein
MPCRVPERLTRQDCLAEFLNALLARGIKDCHAANPNAFLAMSIKDCLAEFLNACSSLKAAVVLETWKEISVTRGPVLASCSRPTA